MTHTGGVSVSGCLANCVEEAVSTGDQEVRNDQCCLFWMISGYMAPFQYLVAIHAGGDVPGSSAKTDNIGQHLVTAGTRACCRICVYLHSLSDDGHRGVLHRVHRISQRASVSLTTRNTSQMLAAGQHVRVALTCPTGKHA
jgi:hypothetical protein